MVTKYTYIFLFLGSLLYLSCNKITVEENNNPQGYADSQIVGDWKVTAMVSDKPYDWDGNGIKERDIYSTWTDCEKDNLYTFQGDKTGSYKLDCSTIKEGDWRILNTSVIIWTPIGSLPEQDKIISLTSNSFTTTKIFYTNNSELFIITKTWTRQ